MLTVRLKMLIIRHIVQEKRARDTHTRITTITLKVLCTNVKREEPSKVLEEKVLMKHTYLS